MATTDCQYYQTTCPVPFSVGEFLFICQFAICPRYKHLLVHFSLILQMVPSSHSTSFLQNLLVQKQFLRVPFSSFDVSHLLSFLFFCGVALTNVFVFVLLSQTENWFDLFLHYY
jgi:hypothetical protein